MRFNEITDATDVTQVKKEKEPERLAVFVIESPSELVGKEFVADAVGIIGRSSSATIIIPEKSVSRKHVFYEFEPKSQRMFIKDLNSTNHTLVNGKRITSAYINPGDRITLGKVTLRFDIRTKAEQSIRDAIKKQAVYDSLTGLLNRSSLEQEVRRLMVEGESFCLVFVDLDNFKSVNDNFGHQKGDDLIRTFANLLRTSIRDTDIACRFGGDEIIVVLRRTDLKLAEDIMERIRKKVKVHLEKQKEELPTLDFSYGISEFPADGVSFNELIEKADKRLYENKRKKKSKDL